MVDVTVVSCVYGDTHARFIPEWADAVAELDPAPGEVVVAMDRPHGVPGASIIEIGCDWRHPQAWYLNQAVSWATTEWVAIIDIDDVVFPDALQGIEDVAEDVWQFGYERSDGHLHLPPQLTAAEYLAEAGNHFAGASAFRTSVFRAIGGFTDVAFQDWSLWRRMAMAGATFKASDRAHYLYRRHDATRSVRELLPSKRGEHLVEMILHDPDTKVAARVA